MKGAWRKLSRQSQLLVSAILLFTAAVALVIPIYALPREPSPGLDPEANRLAEGFELQLDTRGATAEVITNRASPGSRQNVLINGTIH